jgi:Asp-tRNA(Asn)/Glu-tRNA(Gln) amidotransferase A subunit family amidase
MPAEAHEGVHLTDLSATELAEGIRARRVSPVEVVEAFLGRIERINPTLNAYVTVTAERAIAAARDAERRLMTTSPEELGLLHGVPISIKDLSATAGVRTTYGSPAFADNVPDYDDEGVARVFRAGAIMLGKTNSPEFGLHGTTEEGLFGATRNPWNLDHIPGGSSGGAASALAARLCPLAEGSDGGGSIRGPAACCGVVGHKPSRGRIPPWPGAGEAWAGLATSGPMARTVADVALGMDVMAGPAVGDPYRTPNPAESYRSAVGEDVPKLRIALAATHPRYSVDPEVTAAVERAANALRDLGHEVTESFPDTSGMWEQFLTIINAHTAAMVVPDPEKLLPHARTTYVAGKRIPAWEYLATEREMHLAARRVLAWFESYDLLICPTLTRPAPRLGEMAGAGMEVWNKLEGFIPFEYWVNMCGLPGISLPLAVSSSGLPIGVQLIGRQLADRTVLSIAAQLESALPWGSRTPPM